MANKRDRLLICPAFFQQAGAYRNQLDPRVRYRGVNEATTYLIPYEPLARLHTCAILSSQNTGQNAQKIGSYDSVKFIMKIYHEIFIYIFYMYILIVSIVSKIPY
jgi:hypothetical protein